MGETFDPPDLWLENHVYWKAWCTLADLRPEGMSGVPALPPSLIKSWAMFCWPLDVGRLMRRMLAVDRVYRIEMRARQKDEEEAATRSAKLKR